MEKELLRLKNSHRRLGVMLRRGMNLEDVAAMAILLEQMTADAYTMFEEFHQAVKAMGQIDRERPMGLPPKEGRHDV